MELFLKKAVLERTIPKTYKILDESFKEDKEFEGVFESYLEENFISNVPKWNRDIVIKDSYSFMFIQYYFVIVPEINLETGHVHYRTYHISKTIKDPFTFEYATIEVADVKFSQHADEGFYRFIENKNQVIDKTLLQKIYSNKLRTYTVDYGTKRSRELSKSSSEF